MTLMDPLQGPKTFTTTRKSHPEKTGKASPATFGTPQALFPSLSPPLTPPLVPHCLVYPHPTSPRPNVNNMPPHYLFFDSRASSPPSNPISLPPSLPLLSPCCCTLFLPISAIFISCFNGGYSKKAKSWLIRKRKWLEGQCWRSLGCPPPTSLFLPRRPRTLSRLPFPGGEWQRNSFSRLE